MEIDNRIDYEHKHERYFQEQRPEMMPFVPRDATKVLDVGCGEGLFARNIRQRQHCEVWGVELMPDAARTAREHLHRVINEPFHPQLGLPHGYYDCVIFNDCLEHLEAPEEALGFARRLLAPGGTVVASIPNLRYFPVMWALLTRGEWEYVDSGILDRTHLRFFTRKSIMGTFARSGYRIERMEGINAYLWGKGRTHRLLNTLTLGKIEDMKFQQFAVVARPQSSEVVSCDGLAAPGSSLPSSL